MADKEVLFRDAFLWSLKMVNCVNVLIGEVSGHLEFTCSIISFFDQQENAVWKQTNKGSSH